MLLFIIGSVEDIYIEEEIVKEDGYLQIEKAGSITSLGIDAYYEQIYFPVSLMRNRDHSFLK